MESTQRQIRIFNFNPPLKVMTPPSESLPIDAQDYQFARPKLKRQIAHDRVSRYFQKSRSLTHSRLD